MSVSLEECWKPLPHLTQIDRRVDQMPDIIHELKDKGVEFAMLEFANNHLFKV